MGKKSMVATYAELKEQIVEKTEELKKENRILSDKLLLEFTTRLAKCYKEPCGLTNCPSGSMYGADYCYDRNFGVQKSGDSYGFTIRDCFDTIDVLCSLDDEDEKFEIAFYSTNRLLNDDAVCLAKKLGEMFGESRMPLLGEAYDCLNALPHPHWQIAAYGTDKTKAQLIQEAVKKMVNVQ